MKTVRTYIRKSWISKDGNETYAFESDIATWDFRLLTNMGQTDFILIRNRKHFIDLQSHLVVNSYQKLPGINGGKFSTPKLITRMDFCNQIELNSTEFILSKYKMALFYIKTQRIMFSVHQFEYIVHNDFPNLRVRICIEDSGPFENTYVSNSKTNNALIANIILTMIANLKSRYLIINE
jgi:hypothetical protein